MWLYLVILIRLKYSCMHLSCTSSFVVVIPPYLPLFPNARCHRYNFHLLISLEVQKIELLWLINVRNIAFVRKKSQSMYIFVIFLHIYKTKIFKNFSFISDLVELFPLVILVNVVNFIGECRCYSQCTKHYKIVQKTLSICICVKKIDMFFTISTVLKSFIKTKL